MAKAPYFITGPVGASKTCNMVSIARDYLNEGRPVATNIDLFPERMNLNAVGRKTPIIRLPDEPRSTDLQALGHAFDKSIYGYDESRNGGLFLDETAFFLNCREWNKPDRMEFIKWSRLVRKKSWNAFFAVQDLDSVDSQVVNSLCRSIGVCYSSDNITGASGNLIASFIFAPFKIMFNIALKFVLKAPRLHMCTFYVGKSVANGVKHNTAMCWGRWLYEAYDTAQEFFDGHEQLSIPVIDKAGNRKYRDTQTGSETFLPAGFAVPAQYSPVVESKFRDMRACYTILPASILTAWYPDGVPDRPLTAAQAKIKVAELKAKQEMLKALESSVPVKPKKPSFSLLFWFTLPFRYVLFYSLQRQASSIDTDWQSVARVRGILK